MTERLYYTDAYCTCFSARVIERVTWDGRPAVVLDRSAFYPASGGQPADQGALGGVAVVDVQVRQDDAVVHVLESPLPKDGKEIEGEIDWPRRFDHMQQHTGQHVLSAAFGRVLDADTVGFHLGTDVSTIDLNVPRLAPEAVASVEDLVNQVVWEDRPVSTRFVGSDELAALPLRRPPAVDGPVRIVEVSDFDVNPCGGTHVARTGEIGLVRVARLDYRGDETRVEFLCGGRALRDYRVRSAVVDQLATRLTVGYWELDQAVERLQGEAKQLRSDLRRARAGLLKVEVAELYETAAPQGTYRVVQRVWDGRDPGELRALAQELTSRFEVSVLLAGVGERTHLCFACSEGVELDMAALLQEACAQLGGKGGGKPHLAQGSAPATGLARVRAVISDLM
ncbi:MAG: alanyl-tRNA editing protein [Anaerolineae bacterium]|nr:alanyl-tRNA editing protein [Anaerolineae bacterium]